MRTSIQSLQEAAKAAAGNWRKFDCFVWFGAKEKKDPDNWGIFYTHHRDSGLLDQSNASVIQKELEMFATGNQPHVSFESHNHWIVGHVDGFSIRVFQRGRITQAFRKYHELQERMENYPILNDADYSNREYEATLKNIELAAWRLNKDFDLAEDWASEVYSWLSDHECGEIENVDDQGGWPSQGTLQRAFDALGFKSNEEK